MVNTPVEVCGNAPCALLVEAWRTAAEGGAPSLVLSGPADAPVVHWVSKATGARLGVQDADLVGRALTDLTHLETARRELPGWATAVGRLLAAGGVRGRGWARPASGEDAHVLEIEVERLSSGWLVGLRPRAEHTSTDEALAESEARFRALAESAPIGILLSEVGLRLGYVNDSFLSLTGLARYQVLGTEWLGAIHPDHQTDVCLALDAVLLGESRELSLRLRTGEGAQRWIHLRLAPITTPSRAAGFIGVAEDVTERRAWEDRITYQAQHDALTGLVNRRRLMEVLREALGSRRARDRRLAVMFIDLDGFKAVNDSHGHEVGDRVLVEVARRLLRTAREYDLVGRIAGDEFVVLLRDVLSSAEAETAARRILDTLAVPFHVGAHDHAVGASIGLAMPGPFDTVETLMRSADQVMYDAKAAGGSGYRVAPRSEATADAVPDGAPAAGAAPAPPRPRSPGPPGVPHPTGGQR